MCALIVLVLISEKLLFPQDVLPLEPLTGMRNKANQKTRLTFKLELDQLWIGTPGQLRAVRVIVLAYFKP